MKAEQKLALFREILNLVETRAKQIEAANNIYNIGLRQYLDKILGSPTTPTNSKMKDEG